jgi:hypothetical protein
MVEQVGDERRGDAVRQVGHERPPVVTGEQGVPVDVGGVGFDDAHVGKPADHLAQHRHEAAVDLHRGHHRAGLGERQRQRAEAGTDLDHPVARADLRKGRDLADGVRIGDEVLTEVAAWREVVTEQLVDPRPRVRHRATRRSRRGREPR